MLIHPTSKRRIAVEIQLSRQGGHITRERIERYRRSDIRSIWFFGRAQDVLDVPEEMRRLPIFEIGHGHRDAKQARVRQLLKAVLQSRIKYDSLEDLERVPFGLAGYDLVCGGCDKTWHRTGWIVTYPNRIRGDYPQKAWNIMEAAEPSKLLKDFGEASGRIVGIHKRGSSNASNARGDIVCPHCSHKPPREFLDAEQAARCPEIATSGILNLVEWAKLSRGWREVPPPIPDKVYSEIQWRRIVYGGLKRIYAEQRRQADEKRRIKAEEARLAEEARARVRDLMRRAEYGSISKRLGAVLGPVEIESWLDAPLKALDGRTPRELVEAHIAAAGPADGGSRSAVRTLILDVLGVLEPGGHIPADTLGLPLEPHIEARRAEIEQQRLERERLECERQEREASARRKAERERYNDLGTVRVVLSTILKTPPEIDVCLDIPQPSLDGLTIRQYNEKRYPGQPEPAVLVRRALDEGRLVLALDEANQVGQVGKEATSLG